MAYVNTFTITGVPVICTGTGTHNWISADFKIVATANSTNTAYTVQIYARIDAGGWMEWDGTCTLRVNCNGKVGSANMRLAMYNGSEGALTQWDGPVTFSFGNTGSTSLNFSYITIDLTTTTGTNGKPGILHVPDDGNMTAFTVYNYNITIGDGGLEPLLQPPVLTSIENEYPFNSNTAISQYTDRIGVSWTSDISITHSYYRINDGNWIQIPSSATRVNIYNLNAGTNYKIDVYSLNGAGSSNMLTTNIRTRHLIPSVTLQETSKSIDTLTYSWTSDKALTSTQYRIGTDGQWINANSSGTSGSFTINNLEPNTKYVVFFRGTSTADYDSLVSNEPYITSTTYNIAKIINASNVIFGETITLNIEHLSNRAASVTFLVEGNSRTAEFSYNVVNGNNPILFTQQQLDNIYKCFTNQNSVNIKMTATTVGGWKSYTHERTFSLQLTGVAKTAHIDVDGHKRAEVWLGVYNIPRRAVIWVGDDNNKPRRCI